METPALQLGDSCRLDIQSMGYGGVGVARHASGLVCLVGKTLPGESVEARVVQLKRRHAVLQLEKIVVASPLRTAAPCKYFEACGGCHFQHLPYAEQLKAKHQVVQENLDRMVLSKPLAVEPVVAAEPPLNYRNKNFFHVNGIRIGFINSSDHSLIDIDNCPCAPEKTNKILQTVRTWLRGDAGPLRDKILDCLIRESAISGDTMVILVCDAGFAPDDDTTKKLPELKALLKLLPGSSLYVNYKAHASKQSFGERFVHIAGNVSMREQVGPFKMTLSPGSFAQIHAAQAASLYSRLITEMQLTPEDAVLDLYSGSGSLSMYLSRAGKSVYAVEMNRQAVLDAEASLKLNGIDNVVFRTGKCERILDKLTKQGFHWKHVTLNPPRTGAEPGLFPLLKKLGAEKIGYVSCSPPTLRRDILLLEAMGYRLEKIIPFDMFPQTYHLEQLAIFTGPNAAA